MKIKGKAFISGAYSGGSISETEINVSKAKRVIEDAIKAGWIPQCPIVYWHPFADLQDYDFWLEAALVILRTCDVLVLVPGWGTSSGVRREIELARQLHIPLISAAELSTYRL
jgi:hypothetical protein